MPTSMAWTPRLSACSVWPTAERAIHRLYRAIETLPSHERFPLSDPMEDVLAKTASTQERWVTDTEAHLPKARWRIKNQEKMRNRSLKEFYGRERTPRIYR
jgi:hypothetical protein